MSTSRAIGFLALLAYAQAGLLSPLCSNPARAQITGGAPLSSPGAQSSASTPSPIQPTKLPINELPVPEKPSAPPPLEQRSAIDVFRCQRSFVYRGKVLECDSYVRQDGESLRPIIEDVPQAVSELNVYQHNRRAVRTAGYLGTVGLVVMSFGLVLNHNRANPFDPSTYNAPIYVALAGFGLAVGGFTYALGTLKTNETHLGSAVSAYNSAHPESPIELKFSTGFAF